LNFPANCGGFLKAKRRCFLLSLLLFGIANNCFAQTTKAQLEVNETIFSMAAALNSCGYNAGLEDSLPLRQAVRLEVQQAIQKSTEATKAQRVLCQFQVEHQTADAARDVPQYISLALDLGPPPGFTPSLPEADLPPDAAHVLGAASLLQKFYLAAGLHQIWQKHQAEYEGLVSRFHDFVANAITGTDLYLKLPFSSNPGKRFVIYVEPLLAPGQVNSRNYGDDYFLVVSPSEEGLQLQEVRHTYLHYVTDSLAQTHSRSLKRLEPLAELIKNAPLDDSYRYDFALLVNESLIRAIEARTLPGGKSNEEARSQYVQHSMQEGFILTHYFYGVLEHFEKDPVGLKDAYGDFLHDISLETESKRARDVVFSDQAATEVVVHGQKGHREERSLDTAEERLASGDPDGAQKLAMQVLNNPKTTEDQGRALFILARAATLSGDMRSARAYFERSVESAHDPRILAWSHIYLGRILDLQENREEAITHYRAALAAGDPTPDTRTAAEKGLAAPYQPGGKVPR
jgi:tetratricopeptide (TPR) repeat protein